MMMGPLKLLRWSRALFIVACLSLCPHLATAESNAERLARQHVKNAKSHHESGRYEQAIGEYREAYNLVKSPLLLYNIAQEYRLAGEKRNSLSDKRSALAHYQEYLTALANTQLPAGKAKQAAAARQIAQKYVRELSASIAAEEKKNPPSQRVEPRVQAEALAQQASAHHHSGRHRDEIRAYIAAYNAYPNAAYRFYAAEAWEEEGDFQEALNLYQAYLNDQAHEASDYDAERRREKAQERISTLRGKHEERERQRQADAVAEGARQQQALGQDEEAIREYLRAYEIYPRPAYLFQLAWLYDRQQNVSFALSYYKRYLAEADNEDQRKIAEQRKIELGRVQKRREDDAVAKHARDTADAQRERLEAENAPWRRRQSGRVLRGFGIATFVTGLATATAGSIMMLAVYGQAQQLETDARATMAWSDQYAKRLSDGQSLAPKAYIVAGAGLGGAVLGAVFWGVGQRLAKTPVEVSIGPTGPEAASLLLQGRF